MSGYYIHCTEWGAIGQFSALEAYPDLLHFVSTRKGGISKKPFDSLNLGLRTADAVHHVSKNYEILRKEVGLNEEPIISPVQTHSTNVISIDNDNLDNILKVPQTFLSNTDALVTNLTGKFLMVMSADCVPVLFLDTKRKVIGVCHAGWRGVVAGICTKTIERNDLYYSHRKENGLTGRFGTGIMLR